MSFERSLESRTGGRAATMGVIPGDLAISVGNPRTPLPFHWEWRLLTHIARLETGHTPSRRHPEYWGGDVPWIGIRDATGNHGATIFETAQYTNELGIRNSSARILPAQTVCLSRTASVGYVVVMGVPMATSQDFVNWVCGPDLDYRYLKYVLLAERSSFLRFASGTTHQTIYFPEVKAFHIALPTLSIQHGIADTLSALDDRITLLRETNATLEAIAQALFKSWFVDFDPVHAKQQGRAPEGMDDATAALFPDSFEETELGLVPRGWKVGVLGDIAQTARQQMQVSDLHADLHYVGLEHIPRKSLSLTTWGNAEGLESAKVAFSESDILFGKLRPYFHKVVIAPFAGVCSTDILVCQPKIPDYFGVVALHLFSETLVNYADRLSNGAKMPRVNWKDLAGYPVCIPPAGVALKINEAVRPLFARMIANTHQAHTLATLRDSLLPRLISGQLRLPEAEELITEQYISTGTKIWRST